MTDVATKLLATFETLPADEQHELLMQMLRRAGSLPTSTLTDDELTAVAADLFQLLDAEEADGDGSRAR
jgi:hypothetical protein